MYKLKNVNGRVKSLLKTDKDFVRNELAISAAQHIIDSGTLIESDRPDYPICVDGKWYFEGEEVNTEPVVEDNDGKPVERHFKGNRRNR